MDEVTGLPALEQARTAASLGDWPQAYDLLAAADEVAPLGASDLALLAEGAYATGHLDRTIEAWERVYALHMAAGDDLAAAGAAVRVALHLLIDTGLMAPVRGWAARVERLLADRASTPVHAWLAVVRADERLLSGDFPSVREWARTAVALGTEHAEPAVVALGRLAEARSLIFEGDVREGLRLLDEAALATFSGELDPLSVGILYCELLCACRGLAQYDRAEEWTDAMERWRDAQGIGSMGGRCRVHRAEMLHLRGSSIEAEREAVQACEELRPYMRLEFGWPLTELGRIRLRMGDLIGASDALLEAHEIGWDAQPGLALLLLAQGDVAAAASSIRDALEHPLNVPSKEVPPNTDLRRAPLLEATVEIEIAAGDLARARWAADELSRIAASFGSTGLEASAALARGQTALAEGDADAAVRECHIALARWNEIGALHNAAIARMGLADAYRAQGSEDRALLEVRAARATLERIGARPPVVTTEVQNGSSDGNTFRREGDYWSVIFEGRTVRVRHLQGMGYLSRLLGDPGREFHVLDLVAGAEREPKGPPAVEPGLAEAGFGDAGEMLDARAKESYRRRLAEIEEDLTEARDFGDSERAARAEAERDFVVRELSRAVGLSGADRRASSASERGRASVTQAVRHAMARLSEHAPELGEHLGRAIRTGTYCVYLPDSRFSGAWRP